MGTSGPPREEHEHTGGDDDYRERRVEDGSFVDRVVKLGLLPEHLVDRVRRCERQDRSREMEASRRPAPKRTEANRPASGSRGAGRVPRVIDRCPLLMERVPEVTAVVARS